MARRDRLLALWLVVVLAVAAAQVRATDNATATANATVPLVLTLSARSGGLLHVAWALTPAWLDMHSIDSIGSFNVSLNGTLVAQVAAATTEYELGGLQNNTLYAVTVTGNTMDTNETTLMASNELLVSTLDVTNPAAPPMPTLVDAGGGFLRVRVAMPHDTGGVAIAGIYLIVRSNKDSTTTSLSHVASEPEFTIYGLDATTSYRVRAYVVNVAALPSGQSAGLVTNTLTVQLPGACPPPTVLSVTGGSIRLQLNPPIDDGGARIKGYVVYMAVNGSNAFEEVANTVTTPQPFAVEIRRLPRPSNEPLRPMTRYDVKAVAINMMDVCVYTQSVWDITGEPVSVFTAVASLPDAPPAPYFLSATGGQVTIQLLMPGNMAGANLTGFLVMVDGATYDPFLTTEERSYAIAYLRGNSSYSVQAAVITDIGTSEWSAPISVTTGAPSRPSPPLNVSVSDITPSQALVQWLIPADSGGVAIVEYYLKIFSASGMMTVSASGSSSSYRLSGLLAATTYTVKVIAINEVVFESSSTKAKGTTFHTLYAIAPSVPFDIAAVASSGGSIEVAWQAPDESGGSGYDGLIYNVSMVRVAPCYSNVTSSCGACDLVRIPSGDEEYMYGQGCEQPSTASCPDGSMRCCVLTSSSSIGSGHLCSRIANQDRYRLVLGGATVTVFQQLNHSTTYYFTVQAISKAGRSPPASIVGLRTRSPTPPSYPSGIHLINGTGGSVQLTWGPPQDTGGTAIVGYQVYRDYQLLTSQPVMPPFIDCGGDVKASTQYLYSIAAVNASRREGGLGSLLVVTPSVTPPQQITSLSLEARTISWLNVTVATGCDLGGSRAVSYQFIVAQDSGTIASGFFTCCNLLLSGLQAAREYQVSVRVANEVAALEWVNGTFATTSGIPTTPSMIVTRANSYSLIMAPETASIVDRELVAYEIEAYKDGSLIQSYSFPCDSTTGPSLHVCPSTFRIDGLSPNTTYQVSSCALGPNGRSDWNSQSFKTSNESHGVVEFVSQGYEASSGGFANVIVRRVNGTAGSLDVVVNVSQPETVVIGCNCLLGEGCSCRLHLKTSGASSKAGSLLFLDGQETQTIQVSVWEDDPNVTQPMSVVLSLVGAAGLVGAQSHAVIQLNQSQLSGFPSFPRSRVDVLENSSYAKVNIVRLNGSSGAIFFDIETFDISSNASKHYVPLSQTIQMTDRQSQTTVWVRLLDNLYYEGTRVFGMRLRQRMTNSSSAVSYQSSVSTRWINIIDDEDPSMLLPAMPPNPSAVRVTGGEIELVWLASYSSNATTSGYLIRVSVPSNGTDIVSMYNTSSAPSFILSSLQPATLYRFQVAAWNQYSMSEFSGMTLVLTTGPSPPSAPLNFRSIGVGSSYLELAWDLPRDLGGVSVRIFVVSMQGEDGVYRSIAEVSQGAMSYTVKGLSALTAYPFSIAASSAAFDVSASTMTAYLTAATGVATVPAKPPAPTLTRQPTGGTLTFLIGEPHDLGGTYITDYSLYMRKVMLRDDDPNVMPSNTTNLSEDAFQIVCSDASPWANDSTARSCTIYKLLVAANYEFYVVLHNAMGASEASDRAVYRTSPTIGLPSPPENFRASRVTAGNILLEWDLPLDLGGVSGVMGYTVFQRRNPYFSDSYFVLYDGQDSTERQVAIKGLTRGSTYAFAVIAQNAASYCVNLVAQQMSEFTIVTTLSYSLLSPPQSVRLVSTTGGAITIGWQGPDDLAGVPLYGYIVELISDEASSSVIKLTPETLSAGATTFTHSGLTEQTVYQYAVTAVNQDGPGERSAVSAFSTTSATPPKSIIDTQVVEVSGGRVTIAWSPPLDSGGRPIVYYQVTRNDQPNNVRTVTSASFTDRNGLVAQNQYVYSIRAFNELFLGETGNVWAATGPPAVADPPQPTGTSSYGGRIEMTWTSAEDTGGVPILEYDATLFDASGTTLLDSYRGMGTNYTFTSLVANTPYVLELGTVNQVGQGAAARFDVSTSNVDLPSAPPAPTASDILGGSMLLTVYPPYYNGGENVTLLLQNDVAVLGTFDQAQGSTFISGLVALTQYRFRVIASNSYGQTIGEDLVVATAPISTPSAVTAVQFVEATFERLSISWPPVEDAGGDLSLQYEIMYFACDATGLALPTSVVTTVKTPLPRATLVGLNHTTSYSIVVQPLTSSGIYGDSSPTVIFTTEEPLMGRIMVQFADVTIQEGASTVSIPLIRVEGSFGETSYTYQVYDETATAGTNYIVLGADGSMASGVKSGAITIALLDDDVYNPNSTFIVAVRDGPFLTVTQTRVTIQDNGDAGFVSFASSQFRVLENAGVAYLPITRNGGSSPVAIIEPYIVTAHTALETRFTLVESTITFEVGDTVRDLTVIIEDDGDFQYWPDTVVISFRIVEGGVWTGDLLSTNLTAVDDGDVSPPKEITGLKLIGATGGSLQLQWTPPVDRGGANVDLTYLLQLFSNGESSVNTTTVSTSTTIYGLTALTTYQATVASANGAGVGNASSRLLLTTTKATPPTAPLDLSLIATSSSTLLVSWIPPIDAGGAPIVGYTLYNVQNDGSVLPFPSVSCALPTMCSIEGLLALGIYSVQVRAISDASSTTGALSSTGVFQTSNPDVPDPPPLANVTWVSAGAMTIKMFIPFNVGGSDVEQYRLFVRGTSDLEFTVRYQGTTSSFTLYRLDRRTNYEIMYQVINSVGASDFGPVLVYQTLERSLVSAPLDLMVVSATGGAITLQWTEPLDVGGRAVLGYTVMIRSSSMNTSVIGYDGRQIPDTRGVVYGLTANTTYFMFVVAYSEVSNCFSPTEWATSAPIQASTTLPTLPTPAPKVLLVRVTGGIIELMWSPPIDEGGVPITGYTVSLVSPTGTISIFSCGGTGPYSFIHNDLIESTVYTYIVMANSTVGDSPYSDPLVVKTLIATAPSAPLHVRPLQYVTGGAIQIGWDRPVDTGGQPLQGYWIYRDGATVAPNLDASARSFIDTENLWAVTSYTYTIRAISWSTMGSELSLPLSAKTAAASKPQAPLLASNVTGPSFLLMGWAADPDAGGLSVSLFEAKLMQGSVTIGSYVGKDTTYRFARLSAVTNYLFVLVSYNQIGVSNPLSVDFTTLPATAPDVPPAPVAVVVFGGNLTVEVTVPMDTGGVKVTEVRVYESKLGFLGNVSLTEGAQKAQFTAFGLLKTTDYKITASAVNRLGEGLPSPPLAIRTGPLSPPGAVSKAPNVTGATGTTLSVVWIAPIDTGGDSSLSYEVRFLDPTGAATSAVSVTRSVTGIGLKYFTLYAITVRVVNTAGKSGWSPSLSLRTLPDAAGEFNLDATAVRVAENAGQVTLNVQRTNGLSGIVTITYVVVSSGPNAATVGSDFALEPGSSKANGTLTISSLQVSASITILIRDDSVYEFPDEQFGVFLTSVKVNATSVVQAPRIGVNASAIVRILDDGDAGYISFSQANYTVREDAVTLDIPIVREGGSSTKIVLGFTFTDGTATGDRDYRRPPLSVVTMEDGQTTAVLRVAIINDKLYEYPDEFFTITVASVSGGARFKRNVTTISILDDGDQSVPAQPSPPMVVAATGGSVRLALQLPAHNGSATSVLGSYVLRIANPSTGEALFNVTVRVSNVTVVGRLIARTQYAVSVAASNTAGLSPFSPGVIFSTINPTLPSPVADVTLNGSTGGSAVLAWLPPEDTGGVPITKYRIYRLAPQRAPELMSEFLEPVLRGTVYGLTATTTYRFAIQAGNGVFFPEIANGWGMLGRSLEVTTPEASQPGPTLISRDAFANATGGSVSISWSPPLDTGGTPIRSYDVYARNASTGFWFATHVREPAAQFTVVDSLYAFSWYEIFLLALNDVRNTSVPGVVTCATGSKTLATSQDLTRNVTTGSVLLVNDTVFVIGNMSGATKDRLPLTVAHIGKSITKQSATAIGVATLFANLSTSPPTIPRVPLPVTFVNATGGAIAFRVDPPGDTGGVPITGYTVLVDGEEPNRGDVLYDLKSESSSLKKRLIMRITNLSPQSSIEVTAVAVNSISLCDFSKKDLSAPVVFQTTTVSPPEPPQVALLFVTGGGMKLSLVDPFDKGGAEITRYLLYMATSLVTADWQLVSNVSRTANDTKRPSTVVPRLKPQTKYYFHLSVNNGAFESQNSTNVSFSTSMISPPGPCEEPSLVAATGGMLAVAWEDPLDNGGAPVIDFTVTIQPSGATGSSGKRIVRFWKSRNYTFFGLTDETEYSVSVRARNEKGSGPDGLAAAFSTTEGTPPSGNITVTVIASTGGAAILSFNEPLDLGGTSREDMTYHVLVDNDNLLTLTYEDLQSSNGLVPSGGGRRLAANAPIGVVVGGLDPLSLYGIQIQPVNAVATGNVSGAAPASTTEATLPSAPRALEIGDVEGGSVLLTWVSPADTGGLPLLDYVVYMAAKADGPFAPVWQDTIMTCRVASLTAATRYWFYVVATNVLGASPPSSTVTDTTLSVSRPSVPGKITVISVSESTILCEWTAPVDAGGAEITVYSVSVKDETNGGVSTLVSSTTTSATISGLSPATQYSLSVVATNRLASSDPSMSRFVSTATAANTPADPLISCVSKESVSLFWYPHPSGTQYRLLRDGNQVYAGAATHYDDVAVGSKRTYAYTLEAAIGVTWTGVTSSPLPVTTLDPSVDEASCSSNQGFVSETSYKPDTFKSWLLRPADAFATLTLEFTMFDLECNHDFVRIEIADNATLLWQGGCTRTGTFVVHSTTAVRVQFKTDASVEKRGFELLYETDRYAGTDANARIAPPRSSTSGSICASRGMQQNNGTCKCSVGFTGESCSNHMICCANPSRCFHDVCSRNANHVIVVSNEFGDDALGTGAMMDTSERGSASKAVKTLSKGLSLARNGDTVFVYPGVYTGAMNRELQLESRRNVTIESLKGFVWTAIDCERAGRAIAIRQSSVVVDGFTIRNGLVTSAADGGSILLTDSSLDMRNMLVTNSEAAAGNGGLLMARRSNVSTTGTRLEMSSALRGGGLALVDSHLLLEQANITHCKAENGGAVMLDGASTMSGANGSFISKNAATGDGGGVFLERGTAAIKGLQISENEAVRGGAFAAWDKSEVTFDTCALHANKASSDGGGFALIGSVALHANATSVYANMATSRGGGLFVHGAQVSVTFSVTTVPISFARNQAGHGAGVAVASSYLTLSGVSISNSSARGSGGGLAVADSTVKLTHVTISLNAAATTGGGLHAINSEITAEDAVVVDSNQAAMEGGGVYVRNSSVSGSLVVSRNVATQRGGGLFGEGTVSLHNVSIQACTAKEGGGAFLNAASAKIDRVQVVDCPAMSSGGGLAVNDSALTVIGSAIRRCSAVVGGGVATRGVSSISGDLVVAACNASDKGGALYATNTLTLAHVTVQEASALHGGGIFADAANVTASNVTLLACVASLEGGGWSAHTSSLQLTDVRLLGHHSNAMGGALAIVSSHVFHDNVNISGNNANTSGGGVWVVNSTFTAASTVLPAAITSSISSNHARQDGGNVYAEGTGALTSVRIADGHANASGGGIAMQHAAMAIQDCEILENHAAQHGGGLSLRLGSTCDVVDSLVSDNVAAVEGGGASVNDSTLHHDGVFLLRNTAPNGGALSINGVAKVLAVLNGRVSLINASQAMSPANISGDGSAMYLAPRSDVEITGLQIREGAARHGAVFVDAAKLQMRDCDFVENSATEGAALYANAKSNVTIVNSKFSKNVATLSGGAIALTGDSTARSTARITNCTWTQNRAFKTGGAIALSFADVTLADAHFEANSIASDDGGGGAIASITSAAFNATDCTFLNNTVLSETAKGATLYLLKATTARLNKTTIVSDASPGGSVPREGGAVYMTDKDSTLSIVDCELANGRSSSGGAVYVAYAALSLVRTTLRNANALEFGGALYSDSGTIAVENCTFDDNGAFYDGGAIYVRGETSLAVTTSRIRGNRVQDGGAGIFVAPGGGATVAVTNSSLQENTNRGLGSAIFVGRKNTLTLVASQLVNNGGPATEGGTLYAVDAQVVVETTTFQGNRAIRGAAIELSRDATLTMTKSNLVENHATVWGGAVYMSVRAVATIQNCTIEGNTATTGGALYLLGSSTLTMRGSTVATNRALSFGGAVTLVGRAAADVATSAFVSNAAHTGGVLSITQNASVALTATSLTNNSARDFGGAIYVDTLTATDARAIRLQALEARDNGARAGADIYWVYHAWFALACESCRSSSAASGAFKIATSPIAITTGYWPTRVTSGVSLGITKHNWKDPTASALPSPTANTSAPGNSGSGGAAEGTSAVPLSQVPPQRRLDSSSSSSGMDATALDAITANPNQTSPFVGTLWPTLVVRDYYGAIADQDNRTQCLARKVAAETDEFEFYPANAVDISRGYVTLEDAQVLADSRSEPFELFINCTLTADVTHELSVTIKVDTCDPGFESADGRCIRCKKSTYSLDGVKCHLCPLGAKCEGLDESKSPIGVSIPARAEGFFLHDSRESFMGSNCLDPSSWDANDPCKDVEGASNMNMTDRLQRCAKADSFNDFWPPRRVFACLSELEYYSCDTRDACVEENAASVQLATSVHELSQRKQCEYGYGSVTCATCQHGFYKVSNGTCNPCSDPKDPNVAKMTRLLAMVPIGFGVIALLLVWYYFSNATESEIMRQARAARQFQLYDPHAPPQSLVLATKFFLQQRVTDMMARARRTFVLHRRQRHLFHIAPRAVGIPPFRAEKLKILLGFFQIFGGFKKLYEIPWPVEMSRLMDIFSIADFSLVDTTGIECFIHKDYFSNYQLSILGVLTLLFLTTLLLSWGVVRYRVKLSGLPRHCVSCGLPVFKMLRRQPKTLVRRSTMISMLRIQQKEYDLRMRRRSLVTRAKDTVADKLESGLSRMKQWWSSTRVGRWFDRFLVFTRLPASSSRHYPACPTAQRIESEVLLIVVRSNLRLWRSRVRLRLNYQSFQNKCIKLFFWILLIFYPELSQRVVGMFYCDEIGSKHFMSRDKSRLCYEGEWVYYLPLTMLLIVVWVIGVPLLFWTIIFFKRRAGINDKLLLLDAPTHAQLKQRLLREMRQDLVDRGVHVEPERMKTFEKDLMAEFLYNKRLSEPSMVAQVGFIYHSYRNDFWWFEVWDLGRKLCLNCVVGLLAKTGANRIIAGLIVFLIYLSVMLFYQPFKEQSDSTLAGVTQVQLFITLFCGLLLKMGAVHMQDSVVMLLTYTAFISNVLTIAFAVFSIVYEKLDAARKAQRRAHEDHRRAIQSHVRKLWLSAYGWALTEVYLLDNTIRPMPFRVILELARRDRDEKKLLDMDLQLARSLHAHHELNETDENVSASQVQLDLPRPGSIDILPHSSSSSLKQKATDERQGSALKIPTLPELDDSEEALPAGEDNQSRDADEQQH